MVFKYCNFLSVLFVCLMFLSSYAAEDTSREKVEQGVRYIAEQDAERIRLFKIRNRDPKISDHTQNIYSLLKDPEKVSIIHYATQEEKKTIFKAVMASAIIHAPEQMPVYPQDEVIGQYAIIPTDPKEFPVRFGFPKFMNFSDPNNINVDYVPPREGLDEKSYLNRVKHFNILRVLTIFSQAISRNIKYDIPIQDGYFDSFNTMLSDSGVTFESFFEWFKQSYADQPQGYEYEEHLDIIKSRYSYYITHNNRMSGLVKYRPKIYSDRYEGVNKGRNFNFTMTDAGGGGDCGYLSLGITRAAFVDFLSIYTFPTSGASLEETVKRAYAAATENAPAGNLKESLLRLYAKSSTWMTLEDFTLASTSPIVSNRNVMSLNGQIIYVWSFVEDTPNLTLVSAFYNGDDLIANDAYFQQLLQKGTPEQHVYFNGTNHFQQLNPR